MADLLGLDPARTDRLILVDALDRPLGTASKEEAHRDALLHRALSVVLIREGTDGLEVLLSRRADNKYHSGGLWANSVCSHPRAGEDTLEAARRRVPEELGCEIVKIFPGTEVGGPSFVKAIKGPCPWTEIMPSGGVSPDPASLEAWFKAGVACVGLGSQLTPKDIIANGDFNFIETKVRECIQFVEKLKN